MTLKEIVEKIQKLADKLKVEPQSLKLHELSQNGISERQIRKFGGLEKIKRAHFPTTDLSLGEIRSLSQQAAYIRKLEESLAKKELTEKLIKENLQKYVLPVTLPKAQFSNKKPNLAREVVVSLNDTHYGLIVNPLEVNDTNKYGWTEACRRTALLAKQVADYKIEKRDEVTKLHVVLNGDLLQGKIHDMTALTSDLMAMQQIGAAHILTHFIGYVSQFYKEVEVHGICGNHEDSIHRRESSARVTSHKYDSFINPMFYALSLAFRNEKRIKFNFPKGLHIDINLPAGRLVVTHGDTLFSKQLGNPGRNLNIKGLSDELCRWNNGEIRKGREAAKMFLFGHVHTHSSFTTFDGVKVYIAPSLSGVDSYVHSLAINHNQTGQVIFESTKNYILGDPRLVELVSADDDSSLDAIIPIYQRDLVWSKK